MTPFNKAREAHDKAQRTCDPKDYDEAARLYHKAGRHDLARHCEEVAERLRLAESV